MTQLTVQPRKWSQIKPITQGVDWDEIGVRFRGAADHLSVVSNSLVDLLGSKILQHGFWQQPIAAFRRRKPLQKSAAIRLIPILPRRKNEKPEPSPVAEWHAIRLL